MKFEMGFLLMPFPRVIIRHSSAPRSEDYEEGGGECVTLAKVLLHPRHLIVLVRWAAQGDK